MGLVKQVFQNALECSKDEALKAEIQAKYPRLYPFQEGENGICEWHKTFDTPEKGHRHFSSLYAFYPGNLIGFYKDAEQADWVRSKSIAHRYLPVALCLFLIASAGALSRNFLLFCMCCGTITLRTSKEAELPRIAENIVS